MVGIDSHEVVDRRVPDSPQQAEQEQPFHQPELADEPRLGVAPPTEFLAKREGHRDGEVDRHLQRQRDGVRRQALHRGRSWGKGGIA